MRSSTVMGSRRRRSRRTSWRRSTSRGGEVRRAEPVCADSLGGEPVAPGESEGAWFTLEQVAELPMDEQVRLAVLQAFGVEVNRDAVEEELATVLQFPTARAGRGHPDRPVDALDVLRTLTRRPAEEALEGSRSATARLRATSSRRSNGRGPGRRWTERRAACWWWRWWRRWGAANAPPGAYPGRAQPWSEPRGTGRVARMVATYAGFPSTVEAWPEIEDALEKRGMGRGT